MQLRCREGICFNAYHCNYTALSKSEDFVLFEMPFKKKIGKLKLMFGYEKLISKSHPLMTLKNELPLYNMIVNVLLLFD